MVSKIILASPRGFCAGVTRAVGVVELLLQAQTDGSTNGRTIYVRREIVHNKTVVERLRTAGAIFVDDVNEVPVGETVVFSAHGVSPAVRESAAQRGVRVIDATCPLVESVHKQARRNVDKGINIVYIGHRGHDEVEGVLGESSNIVLCETLADVANIKLTSPAIWLSQTTLSVDDTRQIVEALCQRFPFLQNPPTSCICYATQNRQDAVRELANACQMIIVVGSKNSSNSGRLAELAKALGKEAVLVDSADELASFTTLLSAQYEGNIGVTSGASVPEDLVEGVVKHLLTQYPTAQVEELVTATERMKFPLPKLDT